MAKFFFLMLSTIFLGCSTLHPEESITATERDDFIAYDMGFISIDNVQSRKLAAQSIGENRTSQPNSYDLNKIQMSFKKIITERDFPGLESDMEILPSSISIPSWAVTIFNDISSSILPSSDNIFQLAACDGCLAASDIKNKTIYLDPKVLSEIESTYNNADREVLLRGIIAHEMGHYFVSLYTHLYSPNHLTPLGYFDMVDIRYARPTKNVSMRHSEVDLMGQVILNNNSQQRAGSMVQALVMLNRFFSITTGKPSVSLNERIKILESLEK